MNERRTPRPDHLRLLPPMSDDEQPMLVALEGAGEAAAEGAAGTIRVLIAHGQALMRAGYRVLLELDERIVVVGDAASGQEAIGLAEQTRPDVVLLDIGLPGLEQPDGTARIVSHRAFAKAALLLMTASATDERGFSALRAGAVGVLAKETKAAELRRAVRLLACGGAVLPAAAVPRLITELPPQRFDHSGVASQLKELTEREREVLALVGTGLTNAEIAEQLVITPATAKTHVYRAMTKLHARHRAQLVVIAYQAGLVVPRSGAKRSAGAVVAVT
jgi:DNA-binding NarL/FixJ family response regulator